MQPIGRSSSVTDQVESHLTISALYGVIYFSRWHINFAHYDFKVPDQGFHFCIHIFLRRQIILGHIGMINLSLRSFELLYFWLGLFNKASCLPHFFVAEQEPGITMLG